MLKKLAVVLALVVVVLQPAAGAALDLASDPLWKELVLVPLGISVSEGLDATCTASCGSYPFVSCNTSGSCTSVDRNCAAGQQGYVSCGSTTVYCPACPPPPEIDCSEYNTLTCTYTYNYSTGCCTGQHANPKLSCLMVC
jgi:hypothetical protein